MVRTRYVEESVRMIAAIRRPDVRLALALASFALSVATEPVWIHFASPRSAFLHEIRPGMKNVDRAYKEEGGTRRTKC